MTAQSRIFVDAMVWIAAFDKGHENHQYANRTLLEYLNGYQQKSVLLSDYVFNETLSYITRRQKDRERPITIADRERFVNIMTNDVYNSKFVKMLKVTEQDIGTGLSLMKKYPNLTASLTDWTSLILMEREAIPIIMSFDRDIREIVESIELFRHIKVWRY